jgi:Malectin domain
MEKAFDAPSSPPSVVEGMTVIYIPPLDKYVTDYFVDAGADKKKPKYFTGVATRSYTNKKATILGADPYSDSLFQTYRRAKWMNYTFPGLVPRSMNKVKLGFAEILDANCLQEPSARVFDVTVNDMPFLSNFDVLTVVPCHTVHFVEGIWVADATGRIVIGFKSIRGMAFVSVIEIETVG